MGVSSPIVSKPRHTTTVVRTHSIKSQNYEVMSLIFTFHALGTHSATHGKTLCIIYLILPFAQAHKQQNTDNERHYYKLFMYGNGANQTNTQQQKPKQSKQSDRCNNTVYFIYTYSSSGSSVALVAPTNNNLPTRQQSTTTINALPQLSTLRLLPPIPCWPYRTACKAPIMIIHSITTTPAVCM